MAEAKKSSFLFDGDSVAGNLSPGDRAQLEKQLGSPASFPPEFKGWLRDWIRQEVVGSIPGKQIKGLAPSDASFVTITSNSNLANERTLTAGTDITVTDGGPNSPVTIAVDATARLYAVESVTANETLVQANQIVLCDCTAGSITITLPAVASAPIGTWFAIKKIDSSGNFVLIEPNASETIDGLTQDYIEVQYTCLTVVNDGVEWRII